MSNGGGANQTGGGGGGGGGLLSQVGQAAQAGGYPFQSGSPPGLAAGAKPTLPNMQAPPQGLMGAQPDQNMQMPMRAGLNPFAAAQAGNAIQASQLGQSQLGVPHPMAQMPAGGLFGGQQQQAIQPSQMGQSPFGPRPPVNNMGGNQQLGGPAQFGFPQAQQQAQGLAGLGRGPDSTLVHMAPHEVNGLQQLAQRFGGSLTRNPQTGLAEAGFLSSILPLVAGAALSPFITPMGAAAVVGAEEGIRNKDWKKGLMAGLGAYGGGGLGSALEGAGGAAASGAADAATTTAADTAGTTAATTAASTATPAVQAAGTYGDLGTLGGKSALGADMNSLGTESTFAKMAPNSYLGQAGSPAYNLSQHALTPTFETPTFTASTSAPADMTYQEHMTRMGQGVGNLGKPGVASHVAGQVGRMGAMEMAAPALYSAMNPDPIKTTPAAPPKYWVPGRGFNSLYNAQTHGFNPGVFSTEFPTAGLAAGGATSDAAQMANYQRMMDTPIQAPMATPPPTALNNYMADLQKQATTYTPPSVAAPMTSPFAATQPGGPGSGPGGGYNSGYNPHFPPGSRMYGIDLNNLVNGGANSYDYGGLYGKYANPNYSPYGHEPGGGRRAGGGLVSLLEGGHVDGPGDGVSDSVSAMIDGHQPAALAKGEFVIPARIVSELGNGSTDAGSQRLYQMMHRIESARRKVPMSGDSGAYKKLPV